MNDAWFRGECLVPGEEDHRSLTPPQGSSAMRPFVAHARTRVSSDGSGNDCLLLLTCVWTLDPWPSGRWPSGRGVSLASSGSGRIPRQPAHQPVVVLDTAEERGLTNEGRHRGAGLRQYLVRRARRVQNTRKGLQSAACSGLFLGSSLDHGERW